jgi:hypothetical protein
MGKEPIQMGQNKMEEHFQPLYLTLTLLTPAKHHGKFPHPDGEKQNGGAFSALIPNPNPNPNPIP